jgi:hypothetical protein
MSTVTGPARTGGSAATLARTLVVVVIASWPCSTSPSSTSLSIRWRRKFDAPRATVQWVATGYTLALRAVILPAAWVMSRFGAKRGPVHRWLRC